VGPGFSDVDPNSDGDLLQIKLEQRIVRHGFRHPANPRSDPTSRTVAVVAASSVISKA
jgi:hypothetical protein